MCNMDTANTLLPFIHTRYTNHIFYSSFQKDSPVPLVSTKISLIREKRLAGCSPPIFVLSFPPSFLFPPSSLFSQLQSPPSTTLKLHAQPTCVYELSSRSSRPSSARFSRLQFHFRASWQPLPGVAIHQSRRSGKINTVRR